jgi:hypothetical protein
MASTVQIVNQALTKLGAQRITSLTDNTRNAREMNAIFEIKRDAELAAEPWTFAAARAEIPASSTTPAFGWAFMYPLPADFLRLIEVGENYVFYNAEYTQFQLESDPDTGRLAILTDQSSPLRIRYIKKVTNSGLFPALFVESLACRLAAETCETITQSTSKREAAWAERQQAIKEAKRSNAVEQPPRIPPDSSWSRALTE